MNWADAWRPTGRRSICGYDLEYACFGPAPGQAPTWVLLHEGLGCVALWRDFPQKLSDQTGWGVLAYSRAGYGTSNSIALPRPLDYMSRHARKDLPELVSGLGQFALLGHSDGATISAIYAGRVPDARLLGSILIAPHFFTEPVGLQAIAQARRAFETGDLRARLGKYHNDVACAFYGWCDAWLDPGFRDWSVADVLPDVTTPMLTVMGDADPYGSLAQAEIVTETCPTAMPSLILPGVGHAPHLEATDRVLGAASTFATGI